MIDSDRFKPAFKNTDGDMMTVQSHRVLHGRLPFDPGSGARHLQDVYMEWDDLMSHRRVLRGEHLPLSATAPALEAILSPSRLSGPGARPAGPEQ